MWLCRIRTALLAILLAATGLACAPAGDAGDGTSPLTFSVRYDDGVLNRPGGRSGHPVDHRGR